VRMKKFFCVVAIVVCIIFGSAACTGVATPPPLPIFENIEQMASRVTDIVRVEVLDERQEWFAATFLTESPNRMFLEYVHRVIILETFQGNFAPEDVFEIRSSNRFRRGDDLVLFLRISEESRPALANTEGIYRFPNSNESSLTLSAATELRSAHERTHLRLTIGELQEIAAQNFGDGPREVVAHSGYRPRPSMIWLLLALPVIAIAGIVVRRRVMYKKLIG